MKYFFSCIAFVRRHRHHLGHAASDRYLEQLGSCLQCLHLIHCLKWRTKRDVVLRAEEAVASSVEEWFDFVAAKVVTDDDDKEGSDLESRLGRTSRLAHLLAADLSQSAERLGEPFRETLGVDYARLAHRAYEARLRRGGVEALIAEVCERLRPVAFVCEDEGGGGGDSKKVEVDVALGTKLFELYLSLQKFYRVRKGGGEEAEEDIDGRVMLRQQQLSSGSDSGNESSAGSDESSSHCRQQQHGLSRYHRWFLRAVGKWLDIALFKALRRIQVGFNNGIQLEANYRYHPHKIVTESG